MSKSETAAFAVTVDVGFDAIVGLINAARPRTFQAVNIALTVSVQSNHLESLLGA